MTDEQNERLKQIRERVRRLEQSADDPRVKDWGGAYYGDVYFLLSLLDSHAAECNAADWAIERVSHRMNGCLPLLLPLLLWYQTTILKADTIS